MSNQRSTFAKRQRELDLKNKANEKQARRAAKRAEHRDVKGPPIAWEETVRPVSGDEPPPPGTAPASGSEPVPAEARGEDDGAAE